MITLTNPLTTEERLRVTRLLGHDTQNQIQMISSNLTAYEVMATNPELKNDRALPYDVLKALIWHISDTQKSVRLLADFSDIYLSKINLSNLLGDLSTMFKLWRGDVTLNLELEIRELNTQENFLHSVLFNLADNGFQSQKLPHGQKKVDLTLACCDFPEKAVYIPDESRDYKQFIGFHFHNTGEEFPKDKPLIDRLTICPPKGKHGFGLYFTGLVAKVLRAPVNIESKEEQTTVSFYQPIYPDEEAKGEER